MKLQQKIALKKHPKKQQQKMHASLDISKSSNKKQVSNLEQPYLLWCRCTESKNYFIILKMSKVLHITKTIKRILAEQNGNYEEKSSKLNHHTQNSKS